MVFGDINNDEKVNIIDLTKLVKNNNLDDTLLTTISGDFNRNKKFDIRDLDILSHRIANTKNSNLREYIVPNEISNHVIISSKFYKYSDLNDGNIPINLGIDIDFWMQFIDNALERSSYSDNSGITIFSIQNQTRNVGPMYLKLFNLKINNDLFDNIQLFNNIFKKSLINNLFLHKNISGDTIPYTVVREISDNSFSYIPILMNTENNDFYLSTTTSNSFEDLFILVGNPLLVDIIEILDQSLIDISYVFRSHNDNGLGSSANYIWFNNENGINYYSDHLSKNQLNKPIRVLENISNNIFFIDISDNNNRSILSDYNFYSLVSGDISFL